MSIGGAPALGLVMGILLTGIVIRRVMPKMMITVHERRFNDVEMCKAEDARRVPDADPEISTLMPCARGVYQARDGRVCISAMNTGLTGKRFGGVIAGVMGRAAAGDEKRILSGAVRAKAGD